MTDLRLRTLLLCSAVMPRPNGDGAARRLFHFVAFLRAARCGVTCAVDATAGVDDPASPLTGLGARVLVGDDADVERLARAERFDWALFGGWRVAEPLLAVLRSAVPATKIVIDAGDVDFPRTVRREFQEVVGRIGEEVLRDTARELAIYAGADAVLAASRPDADLIADLVGDRRRTFVVPDSEDLAASPFPFRRRRGVVFVADFSHPSDIDALATLGDDILPHVDPKLLADHPLSVTGGHMTDEIRGFAAAWPTVRMLGRVPANETYLERARVTLVPRLHAAGPTRTMIQSLWIGTPLVTTTIGIGGLPLADEREVLVADDHVRFAAGITRLLTDEPLWNELVRVGRETIRASHGHDAARRLLQEALVAIRGAEPAMRKPLSRRRLTQRDYDAAIGHARDAIVCGTPPGSTVAVVSRGDEEAVRLDGRTGWHFPLDEDGDYAGYHPATGTEAVELLEAVRSRGAGYFAIPAPSAWWLGHYRDLRAHLEARYRVIDAADRRCVLVSLHEPPGGPQSLVSAATEETPVVPAGDERDATIAFEGLTDRHTVMRAHAGSPPVISIVIATQHGSAVLAEVIDSLAAQTVESAAFEVVVVSDGSIPGDAAVCRDAGGRLRLALVESPPAGIAAARNLGIDVAAAPLVLFLDDDHVADPGLVAAHLAAHRRCPLEHVAVLGTAAWHPRLPVSEVMRFIAATDHRFPGAVPLPGGRLLDHTHFRVGGSSCKKSLLVRAGGFRHELAGGVEDLEAARRIGRMLARERPRASGFAADVGLVVVSCGEARQHVIRTVGFDELCAHCELRGRSAWRASRVAADPLLDERLGVAGAKRRWRELRVDLAARVARIHELERDVEAAESDHEGLVRELHAHYRWACDAFGTKGIVEAAGDA